MFSVMKLTEEEKKEVVKNRKYIRTCGDPARVRHRAVEQGMKEYILVVKVESGNVCTLSTLKLGTLIIHQYVYFREK